MKSAGVVPAFNPVEDGSAQSGDGGPGPTVDELAFDGGEEALGHGVVPAGPLPSQGEGHAVVDRQLAKSRLVYWQPLSEWNSSPGRRTPMAEGHQQGVGDQLRAHVIGYRPADHLAAGQVDHGGQIGPALPGGQVDTPRRSLVKQQSSRGSNRTLARRHVRSIRGRSRGTTTGARGACWPGCVGPRCGCRRRRVDGRSGLGIRGIS